MRVLLKNELKRMIYSKETLFALLLGMGICIWHAYQYIWGAAIYDEALSFCPESVFYNWLGAFSFPVQSFLYFLILPLLVVLPGGATYHEDRKSQYTVNIYTRCAKWKYLIAKYIAVFLSGGIVFVLPLILSLFLAMVHFPMLRPEEIIGIGPSQIGLMYDLYYTYPWVYVIIFLCIDFFFAGGIAAITLAVTPFVEYRLVVMLIPFVLYFGIYCLNNMVGEMNYAPNYFLLSGMSENNIFEYVIGGVILATVFIFYFVRGLKDEV
ncbi:MAG: hypothetical protein ACI4C5_07400 [Lachnospiraceae bacterium]